MNPAMDLPISAACERNKTPIGEVLSGIARRGDRVLEIGSGTGQHAAHLSEVLPVTWQPSDRPPNVPGIAAWVRHAGRPTLLEPIVLDVLGEWPPGPWDGVFSANTAHIMGWEAVVAMFAGVSSLLGAQGWFALYGPFNYGGEFTSEGNRALDAWARGLDPASGLRNFEDIVALGERHHLEFAADHPMPANNRLLEFRKTR